MAYNGWTNYATWAVNLWLTNDEYSESNLRQMVEDTNSLAHRVDLADALKQYVEDGMPDLGCTLYADLMTAALGDINWWELAEAAIDAYNDEENEAA